MKKSEVVVPRRIFHWVNLISIIVLIISGWYIHKPFAAGLMHTIRFVHFIFMYIFSINVVLRVYYAFFGKTGDWGIFLKQKINNRVILATMRHYFLYDHWPEEITERILQNTAYLVMVILFGVQILTGIMLYYPESQALASLVHFFGGLSFVRTLHFFFVWIFLTFTVVHLYMAFSEEWDKIKLMFFGIADEK